MPVRSSNRLLKTPWGWASLVSVGCLLTVGAVWLWAHEGHVPLPTRGAQVDVERGEVVLSREASDALEVQMAEVESRPVEEGLLAYAAIVSPWQKHALASSRLGGRIARLHAHPGQAVEAGQVLAEVRSLELETLQLELLTALNEARLSEQIVQSMTQAGDGALPEQTLLEAQNRRRQYRNAQEVARSKWLSLGLPSAELETLLSTGKPVLATLPVRSPIHGTVVHADLSVGKVIEPLEHLFEIVDVSTVWAQIGVLEKDLSRVEVGQPVELRLSAYPGEVFPVRVQVKGLHLDPTTHLNTVWAELANPAGDTPRFLPGMTGQARVLLPSRSRGVAVPAAAVIQDGAETYVLVEEAAVAGGSQFQKRNVVPGRRSGDWVEVQAGVVFPGDRVVTRGSHQLGSFFVPGVLRPSPEASRSIRLAVEPAEYRSIGEVLAVDGGVDLPPTARASISSPLAGALVKVHIDRAQTVKAGDILAEVQSLELQGLQLDLLRASLEGQMLEDTLARLKSIGAVIPRRRLLDAESQVIANRQTIEILRRKLLVIGLAGPQLDDLVRDRKLAALLPVRSPMDGVVVSFDRALGQAVKAEEPLFAVHDLTRPLFVGHLAEGEAARVHPGQKARIRLNADPSFLGEGTVVRSDNVFGADSRTLKVWVEPTGPPRQPLRYGQLARLSVTVGVAERSSAKQPLFLAIPLTAVAREGTRTFMFVRKPDGSFERRPVELGRADDLHVEVRRGLEAGDPVAVRGVPALQTAYAVIR